MSYEVVVRDDVGFAVFDTIIKRWQAEPKQFPYDQKGAVIPQNEIPAWLRNDKERLFNFYCYICLYMRGGIESLQAFKAMLRLISDKPELFDPVYAQHLTEAELQPIIAAYVGWDSKAVARFWIENSKRLVRNWNGQASNIFRGLTNYEEALRRIKNKTSNKEWKQACRVDDRGEGFMGFQPKMVSMFVYFIDWEGLLRTDFIYPTPADFHNFRLALALPEKVPEPLVRAEPAQSAQTPDAQQRKAALRAALKAQREAGNLPADKSTRQLNPQERANLREQLRQQRSVVGREKS